MMWSGALEGVQIFILAEELKIECVFFLALSGRESSLVRTKFFWESCVHLDITHLFVYMTRRFVIQGCPTLTERGFMRLVCFVVVVLCGY